MSTSRMPIPDRKRCLELGAAFIEADLHRMRQQAQRLYELAQPRSGDEDARPVRSHGPIGTSHEGDLMQAVEWATAAATLRALADEA